MAEAAKYLGGSVSRICDAQKDQLLDPGRAVYTWWTNKGGKDSFLNLVKRHDIICDGWISLLVFLGPEILKDIQDEVKRSVGRDLAFVATERETEATVQSELHHWIRHDLEAFCGLSFEERVALPNSLRERAELHSRALQRISKALPCTILPLENQHKWATLLQGCQLKGWNSGKWNDAFSHVGKANSNPALPMEGILLTMRVNQGKKAEDIRDAVEKLLSGLENDELCRYLVVLALDDDEVSTQEARMLIETITGHSKCLVLSNPIVSRDEPFPICQSWDMMAEEAWKHGADWVVLLGDDIEIKTPFHYRAIYRAFLDLSQRGFPMFFGCPWWNDENFPGFPTFPIM